MQIENYIHEVSFGWDEDDNESIRVEVVDVNVKFIVSISLSSIQVEGKVIYRWEMVNGAVYNTTSLVDIDDDVDNTGTPV